MAPRIAPAPDEGPSNNGMVNGRRISSAHRRPSYILFAEAQAYDKQNEPTNANLPMWTKIAIRASHEDIDPQELVKRSTFVLICLLKVCACILWGSLYYVLNKKAAALMPFTYFCCVCSNLTFAVSEGMYELFVVIQLFFIFLFPYLVHFTLGGLQESGGVMLWSFLAPLGAAFFRSSKESITWFQGWIVFSIAALGREFYSDYTPITTGFWIMNIVGVLSIVFCAAVFFARALEEEYERSETLLHNVLPATIAKRIKMGECPIIDKNGKVSLLFADVVGFTTAAATMSPNLIIEKFLSEFFHGIDECVEKRKLTKIKTIGDAYMVAGGLEAGGPDDHAAELIQLAADMLEVLALVNLHLGTSFQIRIGMHVGPVIAGVLGTNRLAYDVWGDAVNTASRMESHGKPGQVHLSEDAYAEVKDVKGFSFSCDGRMEVKGKGSMLTYYAVPD